MGGGEEVKKEVNMSQLAGVQFLLSNEGKVRESYLYYSIKDVQSENSDRSHKSLLVSQITVTGTINTKPCATVTGFYAQ